ncbi:zinc-dependent alcohol dehydrogenase [Blautia producta]|uniref:zinc-dependent alcohol dehydrogenase n=1 Tax=Blautia producta TaxID=33035 RepID=UPI0031B5CD23
MRADKICAYEKGKVRLVKCQVKTPKDNEVLVKTLFSTISPGTELAWLNHMENTPGEYPYDPGYSCCGRIEELGSSVSGFQTGDLVVCNQIHCSRFTIEAEKCTKLPQGINPREASAFRLASISLQGIRKAEIQLGDNVAVLGLGPIGNLAAQLGFCAGAGRITGFDFVEWRRVLAERCGITGTEENGEKEEFDSAFDVVIEATGVPQAVNTAFKMAKPLGRVVLLGSTRGNTDGVNFYRDVHRKGITVVGAHEMHRAQNERDQFGHFRSHKRDEETIVELLAQRRIVLDPLISENAEPENAQNIYDRLLSKKEPLMLAAFCWGEE